MNANRIKEQIRDFENKGVSRSIINKYKGLIEKFPDCVRREAVIARAPLIINMFRMEIGRTAGEEKAEEKTLASLELLGKVIDKFSDTSRHLPGKGAMYVFNHFETREDIVNTYMGTMGCVCGLSNRVYLNPENGLLDYHMMTRETLDSILDKTFGTMKQWDYELLEPTKAKLGMMQWSLSSTATVIRELQKNRVKEYDENGVRLVRPAWKKIVELYIDRGYGPLGERGNCERGCIVARSFDLLDIEIGEHIKRNYENPELAKAIIDINTRLSGLLSDGVTPHYEVIVHFIRRGLEGMEHILEMKKLN